MSLKLWLKLNGDLKDYSGNYPNFTANVSGVSQFSTNGLVMPSSFNFNGATSIYNMPFGNDLSSGDFTMFARFKTTGLGSGQTLGGIMSLGYGNLLYFDGGKNLSAVIYAYETSQGQIGSVSVNIPTLFDDTWKNVAVTYSNRNLKLFLNGDLIGQTITVQDYKTSYSNTTIGNNPNNSMYNFYGQMQDVRYYDNCLSDKEIKELAKAKILHYTFDDVEEPTVNLLNISELIENTANALTTFTYDSLLNTRRLAITRNSDYVTYISARRQVSVDINTDYAISFEYKCNDSRNPLDVNVGAHWTGGFGGFMKKYITSDGWCKVEHVRNSSNNTFINLGIGICDSLPVDITCRNFQLEKKDHCTPFVNGSRNTSIIYDKSDYGNHTTTDVATTPAFVEDCKIGKLSTEFDKGVSDAIRLPNLGHKVKYSISFWCKYETGSEMPFGAYQDAIFYWYGINSWKYRHGGVDGEFYYSGGKDLNYWQHRVVTYDGAKVEVFIDGVSCGTKATSGSALLDNLCIGNAYNADLNSIYKYNGFVDDFRIYATALSAEDVKEIYQTRASLDDKGNLFLQGQIEEQKHKKRLFDYSWWNYIGYPSDKIPYPSWTLNGTGDENRFVYDADPFGKQIIVWRCQDTDTVSNDDGGWNSNIPIDSSKKYRFSIWVKRSVAGNGSFFMGCSGVESVTGVYQDNPYFHVVGAGSADGEMQSEWQLFVYYIFPKDYTGAEAPDQGVYKVGQGKVHPGSINRNCASPVRWHPNATDVNFRAYLFYSTDATTKQEFCYPRIDLCDGTEPTIDELLNGYDSKNYDTYMRKGNVSNFFEIKENGDALVSGISEIGVTEGLIAWYPLDGHALDVIGGNHGTVNGAIVASGQGQKCYSFDGVDDKILAQLKGFKGGDVPHTISLWLNVAYLSASRVDPLTLGLADISKYSSLDLYSTRTDWYNYGNDTNLSESLPLNQWVMITLTYKGGGATIANKKMYWNATEKPQFNAGSAGPALQLPDNPVIGLGFDHGRNTAYFNGKIQDVRIYNRALTPEEVMINYDMTRPDGPKMKVAENGTLYLKGKIKEGF